MERDMEELIARVVSAAGVPEAQAERAINLVFAFLKKEAPEPFQDLERYMPEAEAAASAGAVDKPSGGGLMGGLMGMMSGGGGLMGLAGQLSGIGLGTSEMSAVGKEIFAFAREKAGDERVDEVAAAIPGLSQFI
jgi:predicted lipid-binding transport protein (Tim44 family)